MSTTGNVASQTDQTSAITWEQIQRRADWLYDQNWFNPNAFYPTLLCFAEGDQGLGAIQKLFWNINYKMEEGDGSKSLTQIYDSKKGADVMGGVAAWGVEPGKKAGQNEDNINNEDTNMVTGPLTVLEAVKTFEKNIAQKNKSKLTGGWADSGGFKNDPSNHLASLVKVSGLDFPTIPLLRKNGQLGVSKRIESEGKQITLEFLLTDYLTIMSFFGRWQSKWWVYNGVRRVMRAHGSKAGETEGGEGYLGLDYVHVYPNGEIDRLGHLFVGGLIPINLSIGDSFGPDASSSNNIPRLKVKCIYSQAVLGVGHPGDPNHARWYYFE